MRITKNILLTLAIILILFNLLGYVGGIRPYPKGPADTAERVGYFIGSNIFIIVGGILLYISIRLDKKLKRKKDKQLVDSLLSDQTKE